MILALTGPQRAGKTTALNRLVAHHGFYRMSIADMIKERAHDMIGREFTDAQKDQPQPSLGGRTPRDLYIHVGNLDEFAHKLWVQDMFRRQYRGPDELHVIESTGKQFQFSEIVRYCEAVRDGVVIVDVSRPDHDYKDSRSAIRDSYPIINLINNSSQDEFELAVSGLAGSIGLLTHVRSKGDVNKIEAIEKEVYGK